MALKKFTYWQTFVLSPGIDAEIVRKTTIKSNEAFYERIVEIVKSRPEFSWEEYEITLVNVHHADALSPVRTGGMLCDYCDRGFGELHRDECKRTWPTTGPRGWARH